MGTGIEKNSEVAFYCYQKAASQGHQDSMMKLSEMYAKGIGTEKNVNESYKWFKKVAEALLLKEK